MAGRGISEIIELILNSGSKVLSQADKVAAAKAVKQMVKPVFKAALKSNADIAIPKIASGRVTKGLLDPVGYSDVKLSRPIESYGPRAVKSNIPLVADKSLSLQDLVDSYITPTYWDRSNAGETLIGVGDVDLQRGYEMLGGMGFMRGPSAQADQAMTASAAAIIKRYQDMVEKAANEGRDLNLVPISMPPSALDFQGTTSRIAGDLLQQSEPKRDVVKAFDSVMRDRIGNSYTGLLSSELDDFLAAATPDQRKAFIRFIGSEDAAKMGINTDVAGAARYAFTDPSQVLSQPAYGGYTVAKLKSGADSLVSDPQFPHPDFDTQLRGTHMGSFATPIYQGDLFPTSFAKYNAQVDKRGNPLTEANKSYALSLQQPMELVTQQMADREQETLRYLRELGVIP
jgi:hypothetical protein